MFLLLKLLFLLLFLRHVMAHGTAGDSADHGVMAGYVSGNRAHGGTLQAAFGLGLCAKDQQRRGREGYRQLAA